MCLQSETLVNYSLVHARDLSLVVKFPVCFRVAFAPCNYLSQERSFPRKILRKSVEDLPSTISEQLAANAENDRQYFQVGTPVKIICCKKELTLLATGRKTHPRQYDRCEAFILVVCALEPRNRCISRLIVDLKTHRATKIFAGTRISR